MLHKIITISLISIIFTLVALSSYIFYTNEKEITPQPTNWEGLMRLGLVPNTPTRNYIEGDIVLGKIQTSQGDYALIQSGHLETKDFGKQFVLRVK
jgi:hypothetical protein